MLAYPAALAAGRSSPCIVLDERSAEIPLLPEREPVESPLFLDRRPGDRLRRSSPPSTLRDPSLCYLGTISYGIYLYHLPLFALISPTHFTNLCNDSMLLDALKLAATFALAVVSWQFIEKPILRLKDRFPYPRASGPAELESHQASDTLPRRPFGLARGWRQRAETRCRRIVSARLLTRRRASLGTIDQSPQHCQSCSFRFDRHLHRASKDVASHPLAPASEVVGDIEGVVLRSLLDRHVMGRQDSGRHPDHVAPGLAVIAAEREVIAVPRVLGMPPAELLRNPHSERSDDQTTPEFEQLGVDHRASKLIRVRLIQGPPLEVLEVAEPVDPKLGPVDVETGDGQGTSRGPGHPFIVGNGLVQFAAGPHQADQAAGFRPLLNRAITGSPNPSVPTVESAATVETNFQCCPRSAERANMTRVFIILGA